MAIITSPLGPGTAAFGNAQILIAEKQGAEHERLVSTLRDMGCLHLKSCHDLEAVKRSIGRLHAGGLRGDAAAPPSFSPDLIIIDQDLSPHIGRFIDDVRHGRYGRNPFVSLIVTTTSKDNRDIARLIRQGADDVVVKPVTARLLGERIEYVAVHRRPFIVTSDYVGPDRRLDHARPSTVEQLAVPNTLLDQLSGAPGSRISAEDTIKNAVQAIVNARLEQHAQSLGVLSHLVLEAYFSDGEARPGSMAVGAMPVPSIGTSLRIMLSLLRDIQRIGSQVNNLAMIELSKSLRQQIQIMARHRGKLSDSDIMLLKDLVEAVKMTIGVIALPNPDIHGLAKTYQKHGEQPKPPSGPLIIPKKPGDDDKDGGDFFSGF